MLSFPDQQLGRNTRYQLGFGQSDMAVWDPRRALGRPEEFHVKDASFLLWKGHCSVHQRFKPAYVDAFRGTYPGGIGVADPECARERVVLADTVGSTDFIIKAVDEAPTGTALGIATEIHLVQRLANEHQDKTVVSLDPLICPCSTMFRIDAAQLAWVLENLVEGEVVNRVTVDERSAASAKVPLERMLAIV